MELPASFIDYTRALLGDEEYDKLAVAIQQEPPVSIRLNDGKLKIENGFFYGVGAGIKLQNWSFELSYDSTETKTSYEDSNYKINYY